jgi:hypothetical protein
MKNLYAKLNNEKIRNLNFFIIGRPVCSLNKLVPYTGYNESQRFKLKITTSIIGK